MKSMNNHQFSSKLFDLYEKMAIFAAVFVRYRIGTKEFITYQQKFFAKWLSI